jgi:RNA polymerase-binding transcription factor DksA
MAIVIFLILLVVIAYRISTEINRSKKTIITDISSLLGVFYKNLSVLRETIDFYHKICYVLCTMNIENQRKRIEARIKHNIEVLQNPNILPARAQLKRLVIAKEELALKRMDQGCYGTCSRCGATIDSKRLLAVPAALHCLSCQKDYENEIKNKK